jgi:hypothetical protein
MPKIEGGGKTIVSCGKGSIHTPIDPIHNFRHFSQLQILGILP